uniref:KIAA1522 n=1 Tax=Lates calcarifer TaxID=8187 RepID=A0A4W6D525_LATCA
PKGIPAPSALPSPPSEVSVPPVPETSTSPEKVQDTVPPPPVNIPVSPPLSMQGLTSIEHQSTPASTENQSQELTLASVIQEETTPIVTPSLLQKVKLRSVPTSSASGEAPQKPIRRSLIITSPTSTSPPVIVTSQPGLTAARSKESPTSRLSLHSPTSPLDLHKSPTSTASFIFSKSNKRVVIETKSVQASVQNNLEVSAVTKVLSEAESLKKVPPPVAKKPKSKAKENETSEGMEQTAGHGSTAGGYSG